MRNPDVLIGIGVRALNLGHRGLLRVSGGRYPRTVFKMQPVELHTTGRTSGQRRSTMLTAPILEPDRIVLVASKGGYREHPDWYKNLVANPLVELTVVRSDRADAGPNRVPGGAGRAVALRRGRL